MSQKNITEAPALWRSLREWENNPEFEKLVAKEFPAAEPDLLGPVDRRRFLQLIGASAALAGASSCRYEKEELMPFAERPEGYVPGDRRKYSTALERDGVALPLHISTVDGRPIKVDGNPGHPASSGASDVQAQAAILEFYDPDRSRGVQRFASGLRVAGTQEAPISWEAAIAALSASLQARKGDGSKVAVLTEVTASATLASMRSRFLKAFPKARWAQWAPSVQAGPSQGLTQATGREGLRLIYNFAKARTILALDVDFLAGHADGVRHRADYALTRDPDGEMSRLYSVESRFTQVGATADHRLPLRSSQMGNFLLGLQSELGKLGLTGMDVSGGLGLEGTAAEFAHALAGDLMDQEGKSLIVVGDHLSAEVHARALAINERLGALGETLSVIEAPSELDAAGSAGLEDLAGAMGAGGVEVLLVLGGNPAYDAPHDLGFGESLAKVPFSAHLSVYANETSRLCQWHMPMAHFLESWSDARSFDGTYTVVQPTINPLHGGRTASEVLSALLEETPLTGKALVRRAFDGVAASQGAGDSLWRKTLHDGALAGSAGRAAAVGFGGGAAVTLAAGATSGMELLLYPCPKVGDGRFANSGWLQELPEFLTKLTWDNVLLVGVADSKEMKVTTGDLVTLTAGGSSVEAPVYVAPGQAKGSLGLAMGYGRTAAGAIGGDRLEAVDPVGVDVAPLRTVAEPLLVSQATVTKLGKTFPLSTTQEHHLVDDTGMQGREARLPQLIRTASKAEYDEHPNFQKHATPHHPPLESLWKSHEYDGYKWGMTIDLSTCDGCNACVTACQAENNIPIVGKDEVGKGREMHWIRLDSYYRGDPDSPSMSAQPVACAHCENAPCEQVCPVAATVHSDEGLNDMVYNRCVGTRYCGNNCPYKVRRFNYFHFPKRFFGRDPELMRLGNNPDVTVRTRGVMEKCSYCVQRIQSAKIKAKNEDRSLVDGEVTSACQDACPPNAIQFGDLNNPESKVAKAQAGPRSYALLEELNIKPRTQYLARVNNPNPALQPLASPVSSHDANGH
ncbi:MAG: MoCo/4Fe-4S cofactor protein with predicted Tat translocation signal [Glaciecola sp.]|jgi:MoCo/4Fe-4S cofactor protein with predicted Tat translocation signal